MTHDFTWDPCLQRRRILVTGASGFIGSRVAEALACAGATVTALARVVRPRFPSAPSGVTAVACDIRDPQAVARVMRELAPEILYHFAAHPDGDESHAQADAAIRVNLLGTLNLLEAFAAHQGRLFLYGDSSKVYGNGSVPYRESQPPAPTSSYAIAKGAAWDLCLLYSKLHGFAVTSLRPTMIYGPGQGRNIIGFVVESVLEGRREIPLLGGNQTRDPLFIDDAVDAFGAAVRVGPRISGRVVSLGGGCETTVHDLARRVVELMGADTKIVIQAREARPTEIWRSYCDNEEAKALLGWLPAVSLDEGIRRTVADVVRSASEEEMARKVSLAGS